MRLGLSWSRFRADRTCCRMVAFLLCSAVGLGAGGRVVFLPQVVDGPLIRTTIVLAETGGQSNPVVVRFLDAEGMPASLDIDGEGPSSQVHLILESRGLRLLTTSGKGSGKPVAAQIESDRPVGALAILTLTDQDGEFQAETGIHAVEDFREVAIPVEISADLNTGIALHNPNSADIQVRFSAYDLAGSLRSTTPMSVPGGGQVARFVGGRDGLFPEFSAFRGKLVVQGTAPFAATALRQHLRRLNLAAFPAVPLPEGRNYHLIPQLGDGPFPGGVFRTGFVVANLSARQAETSIRFSDREGEPLSLGVAGQIGAVVSFVLPGNGTRFIETDPNGGDGRLKEGTAAISADVPILATGIYTLLDPVGNFRTESAINGTEAHPRLVVPLIAGSGYRTGTAYHNPSDAASVTRLTVHPDGGLDARLQVPAGGQRAEFVDERFGFESPGILGVHSVPELAVAAIRMKAQPLWYTLVPPFRDTSLQWESLNPGHGGQVQHVTADPNLVGRFYLASDMEGYYRTDDFGETWNFVGGQTPSGNVTRVEVEPGNSHRVYLGFSDPRGGGLGISDDGGGNFYRAEIENQTTISAIAVDPANTDHIYVGEGWLEEANPPGGRFGERVVFISRDRGFSWETSVYEASHGDRHVFSISIHPIRREEIIIGAYAGVYRSTDAGRTWSRFAPPPGLSIGRGADLTPDGEWLYAAFVQDDPSSGRKRTRLFARRYPDGPWVDVDTRKVLWAAPTTHWMPKVFPGSGGSRHYVLVGPLETPNDGLYEGRFEIGPAGPEGSIERILWFQDRASTPFDIGWNAYQAMCRTYTYFPSGWAFPAGARGVFTMAQQQTFIGDAADIGAWRVNSTRFVKELAGVRFYRTRGTASTYNYDAAALGNYVIQGQADNGVLESFDAGYSWTEQLRPAGVWNSQYPNGDAVAVLPLDPPVVVAAMAGGFGGGPINGPSAVWYKVLKEPSRPVDEWRTLTTASERKGVPNHRIFHIHSDPAVPQRVYLGTYSGVFLHDDVRTLVSGTGGGLPFRLISAGGPGTHSVRKVEVDPLDSAWVYVRAANGTWRGRRTEAGGYVWTLILADGDPGNGLGDLAVWSDGSKTRLLATRRSFKGSPPFESGFELVLSEDRGDHWRVVLDVSQALSLRAPGPWFAPDMSVHFGGLTGFQKFIFASVHVRSQQKGISFLRGKIEGEQVRWEDWSGDGEGRFEFPVSRKGSIWVQGSGVPALLQSTMGAGLWKRDLE